MENERNKVLLQNMPLGRGKIIKKERKEILM